MQFACANQSESENGTEDEAYNITYEDSVLSSKEFIVEFSELPVDCFQYLGNKVNRFYCEKKSNDSLYAIYKLKANFFPEHYSQSESDYVEKYAGFVKTGDSIEVVYFGINKRVSDFIFLNELEISSDKKVLTKEEHFCWSTEFNFLREKGCIELDLIPENEIGETYRSIGTFEHNSENIWVIDSISGDNPEVSIFYDFDTFNILNNSEFSGKKNMKYFFNDDWGISFIDTDTISCRIISFADNARIISEIDEGIWTYMRRIKKNANTK